MILIDVHAHLDHHDLYEDIDNIISRAKKSGVKIIITNGVDKETNRLSIELSKKYDIVKAALGIYPPDANMRENEEGEFKINNFDIDEEIKFMKNNSKEFVAFGEVGLDLHHGKDLEMQQEVLGKILKLAKKQDKPVIIHSRKAEKQLLDFLENFDNKKLIMHCFSGKKHLIKEAAKRGYYFSVPTNVVRSEHFQGLVEMVNISQLLTETDAPYLGPYPGELNEPANVTETIRVIAKLKKMTEEEVANNIFMNYQKIF